MTDEQVVEEVVEKTVEEPTGKDPVDFDELPEELRPKFEARFNRIYGNMKENERVIQQMAKDQKVLFNKIMKMESSQVERLSGDMIGKLKTDKQKALEEGDYQKAVEVDEQIAAARQATQMRMNEITAEQVAAPEPRPGGLTPAQEAQITQWAFEVDDRGEPKRPWANPSHPLHTKAMTMAAAVLEDPQYDGSVETALKEVERLMGGHVSPNGASPVLSGDQNVRPKSKGTKLSKEQIAVADAMGLSPEDYAKGLS